jgi:DNA polymerase III delta subunit
VLRNASRDSASIGTRKLRQSLDVLADCDSKMKSTSINSQILLEETVAKLLMIRQER